MTHWIVEFYPEEDDSVPNYIDNLPEKEQAQILQVIGQLQELGPLIQGTKLDKLIDGSFRELRKNRHRIIYCRDNKRFILLVAFLKTTDRTPIKFIDMAKKRFKEYQKKTK